MQCEKARPSSPASGCDALHKVGRGNLRGGKGQSRMHPHVLPLLLALPEMLQPHAAYWPFGHTCPARSLYLHACMASSTPSNCRSKWSSTAADIARVLRPAVMGMVPRGGAC